MRASLAEQVLIAARSGGFRIATAESCTGGLIAAALTDVPGSSDVLDCGFVTYSNAAKVKMLGVQEATLAQFGAVSEEVAGEMANGARTRAGVELAVSVTGIAGPGGSEHKPEGRVCFAISVAGQAMTTETVEFGALGRGNVRLAARDHGLQLLRAAIADLASNSAP